MGEPWRGEVSFVSAEALVNSRVDGLLQRIIYIYIVYTYYLVGGLEHLDYFSMQLGSSSSQLLLTHIFQGQDG